MAHEHRLSKRPSIEIGSLQQQLPAVRCESKYWPAYRGGEGPGSGPTVGLPRPDPPVSFGFARNTSKIGGFLASAVLSTKPVAIADFGFCGFCGLGDASLL